ncbi:MAG: PQQ-binding-like beta-propeller repeat protein, partial [Chloroflexota bacterium]
SNYTAMTGLFYNGHFVLSVQNLGGNKGYRLINWTTEGTSTNFTSRVLNNISFPLSDIGAWNDFDLGITVQTQSFTEGAIYGGNLTCVSLTTGQVLWTKDLGTETMFNSNRVGTIAEGKIAICMENNHFTCWDLLTGRQLWVSERTEYPWGDFWSYDSTYYNGLLMAGSYEGVYAFNMADGKIVWNFKAPDVPYETPYNEYSFHSASFAADGKLVIYSDEHTVTQPVTRGWKFYCLNATTGERIWSLQGYDSDARFCPIAPGDGYLILVDQYSGTQWVVGKGKSQTTVTAPDVIVPKGTGVVIKGSVLDLSPAQPNTPCVSKDSMELQMEYLHMQMPRDGLWHNETMTGVPVELTAVAPDGNVVDIGTVTTSAYYGTYEMAWTPPNEGTYKIIASFAADDSYGSSEASTAIAVGPATEPVQIPQQVTPPDYTMTIVGVGIAVILAVAIVGIVLYRKK